MIEDLQTMPLKIREDLSDYDFIADINIIGRQFLYMYRVFDGNHFNRQLYFNFDQGLIAFKSRAGDFWYI